MLQNDETYKDFITNDSNDVTMTNNLLIFKRNKQESCLRSYDTQNPNKTRSVELEGGKNIIAILRTKLSVDPEAIRDVLISNDGTNIIYLTRIQSVVTILRHELAKNAEQYIIYQKFDDSNTTCICSVCLTACL